jgi:hypothetical protein
VDITDSAVVDEALAAVGEGSGKASESLGVVAEASVDESPADSGAVEKEAAETEASEFRPIESQEALENVLKGRLERAQRSAEKKYQKQVEELASRLKEYEDAKLSVDEKKDKRLTELEQSLAEANDRYQKLERTRIVESLAREMGLPEKFWGRVQGDTDDEIISDINDMLEGLPRSERQNAPLTQAPKVSVQATNSEPEIEENAKSIVDKMGGFLNF